MPFSNKMLKSHMLYVVFWAFFGTQVFNCCPGLHDGKIYLPLKTFGHGLLRDVLKCISPAEKIDEMWHGMKQHGMNYPLVSLVSV